MHGIYYIILPFFAVLLVLLTTAALYMGVFRAHRESASFGKKTISGIASGVLSCLAWFFMYSHHYLGW
jgi:sorbitol-specific phosphotransferase system component IIC